jgi:hypothetical protein
MLELLFGMHSSAVQWATLQSGLDCRDQPYAAGQEVDVQVQDVVAETSHRQLEKFQADAATPARRHVEGDQEASGGQVVGLDTLTCRTSQHVSFLEGC